MAFLIAFFITWADTNRIYINTNNFENRYPILLIDCQRNVQLNCSFENKVHNLANLILQNFLPNSKFFLEGTPRIDMFTTFIDN
jgi:hypothetical protein